MLGAFVALGWVILSWGMMVGHVLGLEARSAVLFFVCGT